MATHDEPEAEEQGIALSAGDILNELGEMGHRGRSFNASEIGKAMTRMGFDKRKIKGYPKYLVVKVDYGARDQEQKSDAKEFIPEML